MTVQEAYGLLYTGVLIAMAALLAVMLVRSARGPGVTDRLLAINMIGTLVIASIAVLALFLGEAWLLDVALIYTMISLAAVLILARVYIPDRPDKQAPFREDGPDPPRRRRRTKRERREEDRHA